MPSTDGGNDPSHLSRWTASASRAAGRAWLVGRIGVIAASPGVAPQVQARLDPAAQTPAGYQQEMVHDQDKQAADWLDLRREQAAEAHPVREQQPKQQTARSDRSGLGRRSGRNTQSRERGR